jgi:hypothetical protein
MVTVKLVLHIGWVNSPPAFSTATETDADVANQRLRSPAYHPPPHHLDNMAAAVLLPAPGVPTCDYDYGAAVEIPDSRDPSLPTTGDPLEYVDIFVDDFISLAQQPNICRVRHLSTEPIMKDFTARILDADYTMAQYQLVPCHYQDLWTSHQINWTLGMPLALSGGPN